MREEIELAKAEVTGKISKLTKGAAVAGAAGRVPDLRHHDALPHARLVPERPLRLGSLDRASWRSRSSCSCSPGWPAFIALRLFKKGAPPTPDLAIEEAKLIREQFEAQKIQRDQVHRTLERGEEVTR